MKSVAIIIPCYNEEESVPQLLHKLKELEQELQFKYEHHFIFVDDGSQDKTYSLLNKAINQLKSAQIIRHEKNQNLGAALKTGIRNSNEVDYLAFLDSDCTYEPSIILELLKSLDNGYDLATVSPYHPKGMVEGVPAWRLSLSKGLSLIYKILLNTPFSTYTAMVRAVKKEKVVNLLSPKNDFSFVAEFFLKAIQQNEKISEIPTILRVRQYGVSKMSTFRTIKSHLKIILKLLQGKEI